MDQQTPTENVSEDHWGSDRLGRKEVAGKLTQILDGVEGPLVISVEGGFGAGKTFFADRWAKDLKKIDVVIEFNAWETDHADDPLIAFSAALLRHAPTGRGDEAQKSVLKTVKTVALAGAGGAAKKLGQKFLGVGAEQVTDELKELFGPMFAKPDESATVVDGAETADEPQTGELKKDTAAGIAKAGTDALAASAADQLTQFLARERLRQKALPDQLAEMRKALGTNDNPTPRIIVIIDELDRCRPDYAVSLLEDIKHLFHVEGYVFILMINEKRLSSTASHLFGEGDQGEPYLKKFIDWRFRLPSVPFGALCYEHLQLLPETQAILSDQDDAENISASADKLGVTARQLISAFQQARYSIKLAGENPRVDRSLLVLLALLREVSVDPRALQSEDENRSDIETNAAQSFPAYLKNFVALGGGFGGSTSFAKKVEVGSSRISRSDEPRSKEADSLVYIAHNFYAGRISEQLLRKLNKDYFLNHVEMIEISASISV